MTAFQFKSTATDGSVLSGTLTYTPPPSPPPPPPPGKVPLGILGVWSVLAFDDEFTGGLDTSKWTVESGTSWSASGNTSDASNIIMTNPGLTLRQASAKSGVQIMSKYTLPVGGCCEAKIWFPGPGAPAPGMAIYNWPAWWTACAADWPAGGEIDIAEGLSGTLTCNYHSAAGDFNGPEPGPAGAWSNSWHTYGMLRGPNSIVFYYDGKAVHTQVSSDNGNGQNLLLDITTGSFGGPVSIYGPASDMKVAYVRAWTP